MQLEALIDLQNLKTLSRHNHSFIREILEVYLTNTPRDLRDLSEAVQTERWPDVRYYAHKLKSSSFTLGFDEGYAVFMEIERLLKDGLDPQPVPELYQKAEALCEKAFIEIKIELTNYV
ncbi:MAG: Hpt domain-containing protein [Flavobacteriales bacterium]|nr:Hpt domain-containing protein [Flavobacteriales bacterium]